MPAMSEKEFEEFKGLVRDKINDGFEVVRKEIQSDLDNLQRSGVEASNQRVKDLEARLAEREKEHAEKLAEMATTFKDELRVLDGQLAVARQSTERLGYDLKPGDRGYNPDFKGGFIQDVALMRDQVRKMTGYYGALNGAQPEKRAWTPINTGISGAPGGLLDPDAASAFIDNVVSTQVGLQLCTVRRMNANTANIDELKMAGRRLAAGVETTEITEPQGSAFSTARRQLVTKELYFIEDLTLAFLEDNIEKRNAEATIASMIARGVGNDLEDLAWNGDEGSGDAFVKLNDGWFDLIESASDEQIYTGTTDAAASDTLAGMSAKMPFEFVTKEDTTFFVPVPFAQHYANEIGTRETAMGDNVFINGLPALRFFGRRVIPCPVFALQGTPNSKALLTSASNLVFGVQRAITVDSEWRPRKRAIEYTLTMRVDYQVAVTRACVRTQTIATGLQ